MTNIFECIFVLTNDSFTWFPSTFSVKIKGLFWVMGTESEQVVFGIVGYLVLDNSGASINTVESLLLNFTSLA